MRSNGSWDSYKPSYWLQAQLLTHLGTGLAQQDQWQCAWTSGMPGTLHQASRCNGCCFTFTFQKLCKFLLWPISIRSHRRKGILRNVFLTQLIWHWAKVENMRAHSLSTWYPYKLLLSIFNFQVNMLEHDATTICTAKKTLSLWNSLTLSLWYSVT